MCFLPRKREKKRLINAKTISVLTTENIVLNLSFQTEIYKTIKKYKLFISHHKILL